VADTQGFREVGSGQALAIGQFQYVAVAAGQSAGSRSDQLSELILCGQRANGPGPMDALSGSSSKAGSRRCSCRARSAVRRAMA
jgi:hypothetical protein